VVTLHTTWFNNKKFYVVPTLCLCDLYGSQSKQQLLPYKTLRDWFCITEVVSVYSAAYTESLYKTDTLHLQRVNLGTRWRWVVNITTWSHCPPPPPPAGNNPDTHWIVRHSAIEVQLYPKSQCHKRLVSSDSSMADKLQNTKLPFWLDKYTIAQYKQYYIHKVVQRILYILLNL
jgi:hypothetical protein